MHSSRPSIPAQPNGFTLIELSIVLVIIGLIVGGVLVGQDLIKAAQIRAEVTQLERYNTAVNTFRGKYNGIPGDLLGGSSYFGTAVANQGASAGLGNGDGIVQGTSTGAAGGSCSNCVSGEGLLFWYELNAASLISDNTTAGVDYAIADSTYSIGSTYIPNGKIPGTTVSVNSANGLNYWVVAKQSGDLTAGVPATNAAGLTPIQAYQLDSKIDDGAPATGTIVSITNGTPGTVAGGNAGGGATYCYDATSGAYQIASYANSVYCQLGVRTNF